MKKILLTMTLVCCLIVGMTGCGNSNNDENGGNTNGGETIEIVAKGFQHQFWKAVNQGADKAAKDFGVTIHFNGPKSETAIQEQVQMLSNAINKKPAAIALASLDTTAQLDLLQQAKDANIPIIGFDSGVPDAPDGSVLANVATDNKGAAALGAKTHFNALKERIQKASLENKVRLGVLSQELNSQSLTDRTEGYIKEMEKLVKELPNVGDKVAIVGHDKFKNNVDEKDAVVIIDLKVPAQVTDADGVTQAQTLLNKTDLIGIFGSNEFGAKSIVTANDGLGGNKIGIGDDKIIAVGFDSGKVQLDAIRNQKMLASVTQDPVQIGYKAVELAVKAARGEKVSDLEIEARVYDYKNMDSDEIKPLLYE